MAGQAETLSSQDIDLVVVQVSNVNMTKYETWLRQNGVAFDIHVATGDFADRQSTWGIKGLPWLILADPEHVVRAEGFAVDELERQLRSLGAD